MAADNSSSGMTTPGCFRHQWRKSINRFWCLPTDNKLEIFTCILTNVNLLDCALSRGSAHADSPKKENWMTRWRIQLQINQARCSCELESAYLWINRRDFSSLFPSSPFSHKIRKPLKVWNPLKVPFSWRTGRIKRRFRPSLRRRRLFPDSESYFYTTK